MHKVEKMETPSSCEIGDQVTMGKSVFWKHSGTELLSRLKALGQGHFDLGVTCGAKISLQDQIYRVRKLMTLTNPQFPRRKRKLQQFLKDNFKSMTGVLSYEELPMKQNVKRLDGGQLSRSSSSSCVLDMEDSAGSLQDNQLMNSYSIKSASVDSVIDQLPSSLNVKFGCPLNKEMDIDSDRSTIGWEPTSPTCLSNYKSPSPYVIDLVNGADNFCFKETNQVHSQLPRRRSKRLLNFIGDRFRESFIRIGPDFQANIPKFNTDADNDGGSRWLGTCVWPIEGQHVRKTSRKAGKGRPDTCCCVSPGSSNCSNHHIKKERLRMQVDLGPVYFVWKLNEMGAEIPNSSSLFLD
ncbi:ELM2 domain-containing protein [Heracleum sosnowskyi]|uniref:ELM2 domain-containing protein n=1 Tax=Heracleum sosnowskyi TaxID=360622 RepID=A0AAD8N053_9APIA|nr:ELM2 domain-containing protein [Heracleum sosnowskyi]